MLGSLMATVYGIPASTLSSLDGGGLHHLCHFVWNCVEKKRNPQDHPAQEVVGSPVYVVQRYESQQHFTQRGSGATKSAVSAGLQQIQGKPRLTYYFYRKLLAHC